MHLLHGSTAGYRASEFRVMGWCKGQEPAGLWMARLRSRVCGHLSIIDRGEPPGVEAS